MKAKRGFNWKRALLILVVASALCCLGAVIAVTVSNQSLPESSATLERLGEEQKALLAETAHLRASLGEAVWRGWGQADIPLIVYNEGYAFLVGYPDPPAGWLKVPDGEPVGGPWETVEDDLFEGQTYYRQPLPASGETPQAFTVKIGDRWAASLGTQEWMKISLADTIRQDVPGPLKDIVPYAVAVNLLIGDSEKYIAGLAHESFHAFQAMTQPDRLAAAEHANREESRYPWETEGLHEAWQEELDLLVQALRAESGEDTAKVARQFLEQRKERRTNFNLDSALVDFERQREWLEGLAKYTELEIWRQAFITSSYAPLPAMQSVARFKGYSGFETRWSQEVNQIRLMTSDEGETRFYYTGMAQAFLLDRLAPGWKERLWSSQAWLEEILAEAVEGR